ncbi:hypothetical protein NAS141_05078 [Sulfitobacter sp. NAS-14.1]|nr:hypothetical protein NAS141_05078 [Sulfitobacter sp. NAS-14.1]
MHKAVHRVVLWCRLQILPDGQKIDVRRAHVFHDLHNRLTILAQTDHDAGFGKHRRIKLFDPLQQTQRMEIPRPGADLGVEAGHCFQIVVKHIRARLDHGFQHFGITADEIGGQDLDRGARGPFAHGADGLGKMFCPAVFDVVAVHAGDHHVVQPQFGHRIGHTPGFKDVQRFRRAPCRDVAEGTGAGADLAHDHHGGMALRPAFAHIRAAGFFADSHQLVLAHDLCGIRIAFATRRLHPDPRRLFRLWIVGASGLFRVALLGDFQVSHDQAPFGIRPLCSRFARRMKEAVVSCGADMRCAPIRIRRLADHRAPGAKRFRIVFAQAHQGDTQNDLSRPR